MNFRPRFARRPYVTKLIFTTMEYFHARGNMSIKPASCFDGSIRFEEKSRYLLLEYETVVGGKGYYTMKMEK